jgi:hypothetical protein
MVKPQHNRNQTSQRTVKTSSPETAHVPLSISVLGNEQEHPAITFPWHYKYGIKTMRYRHRIKSEKHRTHRELQLAKIIVDEQLIGVFLEINPVCPAVPKDGDVPRPDQIP